MRAYYVGERVKLGYRPIRIRSDLNSGLDSGDQTIIKVVLAFVNPNPTL